MRAVDRVVLADIEVIRIGVKRRGIEFGNITERLIRGGCDNVYLTVFFGFLGGFFRPLTRNADVDLFLLLRMVCVRLASLQ